MFPSGSGTGGMGERVATYAARAVVNEPSKNIFFGFFKIH
jgi:hypothetical protein